jgi:glycosyltransferase involved in cell wall biosynthesis
VKSLVSGIGGEVHVIHNGFDSAFWRPDPTARRGRTVVVVAGIPGSLPESAKERTLHLKGVWLTLEVARKLPDVAFALAGAESAILPQGTACPPNVTFVGYLAPGQLRRLYQHAKVYAIPSLTEGMPSSLADAMLCECVPVGSNVNGIPRLIGETGLIVERPDPDLWAAAVEKALASDAGHKARERIAAQFSMARRFAALREVVAP